MRQAPLPGTTNRTGPRLIERPRLLRLLDESAAQTILLIAPAGYGKTTLARQWAASDPSVRWYTARTGSADVAQLSVELAELLEDGASTTGLSDYVSQFVRARPSPAQQVTEIVDGFAGAAGAFAPLTLVIDEYQLIAEDEAAERFVHELQAKLGPRLLVASRLRPSWATARLQIYGDLLELGPEELALTEEEAKDVLGENSCTSPTLLEQARGWPAVIGLAAQAESPTDALPEGAGSTLFRFFAEELFLATSPELQERLMTLALLPSLSKIFVDAALGSDSQSVIDAAIESGLATHGPDSAELHPLVREYLFTKLRGREDLNERVRVAFRTSLHGGYWDHAFELIERFNATDLFDELLEHSFKPLLSSGRIATLDRVTHFAHASGADISPLLTIVDAELAFRSGAFSRSEALATRAASELGRLHPLASHAAWIAGQASQLSFDDARAARHFTDATNFATTEGDTVNALWGLAMTLFQAEEPSSTAVLEQLRARRPRSPIDLIRGTQAELLARRCTSVAQAPRLAEAMNALEAVTDPRLTTGFINSCAYDLFLAGRYEQAHDMASSMQDLVDEYQLNWARPHSQWLLAAVALGRRHFRESDTLLRRVESAADELRYGQLLLNAACLRARLLLALGRPREALSALAVDETNPANRAMKGEFIATRALVLAVSGAPRVECSRAVDRALELTSLVETRAYAACALAVSALRNGGDEEPIVESLRLVEQLGVWDAFVCSARAWPALLVRVREMQIVQPPLLVALRESEDYDLARRAGLDLGRRSRTHAAGVALSAREQEVLELVQQGLTNRQISQALFISETTVKVHVRHILEKTGTRTRTEAATTSGLQR